MTDVPAWTWETSDDLPPRAPASSGAAEGVDWEDVGKGAVGGLGRGAAGLAGTPGDIGNLARYLAGKAGVPEHIIETGAAVARGNPFLNVFTGPSSADIQAAIESRTGKFYEPRTVPGQYASTLAEFAPSAVLPVGGAAARTFNTVVPALASETAGQFTKGTAAEPYARGVAGLVGGVAAGKALTPTAPATASHAADVATLRRAGIPMTAGERTGSKNLQWIESTAGDMPFSSRAVQDQKQAQALALDRAITGQVFDPAELTRRGLPPGSALPQQDVMAHGRQSLSDEYTRLAGANQLRSDPQLMRDLRTAQTNYERNVLPSQRAGGKGTSDIEAIRNDIVDSLIAGKGRMPGDVYQATRSRLGTQAKGAQTGDPQLATALRDTRRALDAAMQRGLSLEDAAAWALNNQRYANMKQLVPAVAAAGEHLSPAKIAQSMRAGRAEQYARGAGPVDELANAAATVLKPLPQSGTAPRLGYQKMFDVPTLLASGGGGLLGSAFGPLGIAAGIAAPHVVSRVIVSRPGQAYLGNQVLPQRARDILAQTIVEQSATQPSIRERNAAEQAAAEQKREDDLRELGLR